MNSLSNTLSSIRPFSVPYPSVAHAAIPFILTVPFWLTFYDGILRTNDYVRSMAAGELDINSNPEFDFIIVGGGSAGCVLANRLSENYTVLLLELGGDPNPISRLAISYYILQRSPSTDLLYETVPQNNLALAMHNQRVFWPRGTGLGGSSNLNAMIYQRGNPNDYDNWANITRDKEWSYWNVLPYFKKLEDYEGSFPSEKYHGKGGPIHVERVRQSYMEKYFIEAGREKGYPIKDPSGYQTTGFSPNDVTMKNGLRWGTYTGYIKPILERKNLKIYRYSRVTKVNLDENLEARSVTYFRHRRYFTATAKKEIILSAGAIDTPKILMLSGIGPKPHLESLGIPCKLDLPVGQNLQDHMMTILGPFRVSTPESLLLGRTVNLRAPIEFLTQRRGAIAATTHGAIGYVSTSAYNYDNSWPDIQFTFASIGTFYGVHQVLQQYFNVKADILEKYFKDTPDEPNIEKDANFVAISQERPKSRGEIKLSSSDPFVPPLIDPKYFSHPDDIISFTEGLKILVDIMENTTVYRNINARLIKPFPGCESLPFKTLKYYECYIRHMTFTIYHPVGTASMGRGLEDKNAVVDSKLRVFKTKGLRVIDASVMPVIVNANTNAPTIMIGEVGSNFILKHWKLCESDKRKNC